MARDRFIWFDDGVPPSPNALRWVTEDYLGDMLESIAWDGGRWFVRVTGNYSHPLRRLTLGKHVALHEELCQEQRWIEVWRDVDSVDVITRRADEATNALADGLAALIARHWGGRRDEGPTERQRKMLKVEYEYQGVVWVGLMTESHPVKWSKATVWVYEFRDVGTDDLHERAGGELRGTAAYSGRPELVLQSGKVPKHVLAGLGRAVPTKNLRAVDGKLAKGKR